MRGRLNTGPFTVSSPNTVESWWVFVNNSTGTAVISPNGRLTQGIQGAIGTNSNRNIEIRHYISSFNDAVGRAFGDLGLAGDQTPTKYIPTRGQNYMKLAGPTNTAPFNTGGPLTPNLTHKQSQKIDATIGSAINSTVDFLQFIAWFFYPGNWLRAVEFLFGTILFGFGAWSMLQARGERSGRFYGYGGLVRRSPLGRALGGGRHRQTDVERVRSGGKSGGSQRTQRRRERDRRRPRRGQQRTPQS